MSDDENDKDLSFFMDTSSVVDESDVSDDDIQIESAISPTTPKSKKLKNSPNSKQKVKKTRSSSRNKSDDDDDDVIITDKPFSLQQQDDIPPEFTEPIYPFENDYQAPILKSKESQALEVAVNDIRKDITKMLNDDDDDDDIVLNPAPAPIPKKEGDLTLIFVYPPEDFQEEKIMHAGQTFLSVFQTLPDRFEDYSVQIDGLTYDPKEVLIELLSDYTKVILTEPEQSASLKGFKKLAFVLPSGEKKKLALDPNWTFKETLIKLNIPNGKLMFDGEELPLNQKISENDDLEDGDQLDVCLQ